ncbi:hypothetical protein NMY22_g5540 [Coprinellus aureogranulatus]|nr:hypothetical protein NMY22_g5540 [Coprinellus aureogranulatus]
MITLNTPLALRTIPPTDPVLRRMLRRTGDLSLAAVGTPHVSETCEKVSRLGEVMPYEDESTPRHQTIRCSEDFCGDNRIQLARTALLLSTFGKMRSGDPVSRFRDHLGVFPNAPGLRPWDVYKQIQPLLNLPLILLTNYSIVRIQPMSPADDNHPPRFGTVPPQAQAPKPRKGALQWAPRKKPTNTDPLVHHGRHFGRAIYAFANVHALLLAGLAANSEGPVETQQERRDIRVFLKLLDLIPGLEERIMDGSPEEVLAVANMVQKGANSSRSDDTRSLKSAVIDWISPADGLRPPLHRNSKTDRGFFHEVTGALLCPTSLDWTDPEVKNQLKNKEIITSGDDWPVFLYCDEKFDSADPWRGLLRGRLLVLGYKHIFTSPSSVEDAPRATRNGNAKLHGMSRVTSASIAYVATQVRFALSSSSVFTRSDVTDSETFYQSVLEHLEDPEEGYEVKELLAWWNRQIFPAASNGSRIPPTNSALSQLKARRAAVKAAALASS